MAAAGTAEPCPSDLGAGHWPGLHLSFIPKTWADCCPATAAVPALLVVTHPILSTVQGSRRPTFPCMQSPCCPFPPMSWIPSWVPCRPAGDLEDCERRVGEAGPSQMPLTP